MKNLEFSIKERHEDEIVADPFRRKNIFYSNTDICFLFTFLSIYTWVHKAETRPLPVSRAIRTR
jgi:hypothetical protein